MTIGETLADPENPVALPVITVDEPSLSLVLGINTSPMAGQGGGTKLTARQIRERLDRELVGNVSIRIIDTERNYYQRQWATPEAGARETLTTVRTLASELAVAGAELPPPLRSELPSAARRALPSAG